MPNALDKTFQGTRRPLIKYLPAIFQQQADLEKFLAPFDTRFAQIESILNGMERNFAVSFAPFDDFLPWLAQCVGHVFDAEWDEDRRRRFLAQAVELYRWRGTTSGLKRYLDLCLDLGPGEVEIREGRWPGGMQIGVASRIGYVANNKAGEPNGAETGKPGIDVTSHDYYVVDTVTPTDLPAGLAGASIPDGEPIQLYYDAEFIRRIDLLKDSEGRPAGVRVEYMARDATGTRTLRQSTLRSPKDLVEANRINVSRRDGLVDYRFSPACGGARVLAGGTLLVRDLERPYRFIVDICRAFPEPARTEQTEAQKAKAVRTEIEKLGRKVRALLDAEKPAHTDYAVRIAPAAGRPGPNFMQIGEYSSIGLDTTVA